MAVLIIGEDVGHAGTVGRLVQLALREYAVKHGAAWYFDSDATILQWQGEIDLKNPFGWLVPDLRYTKIASAKKHGEAYGRSTLVGGRPLKLRGHVRGAPKAVEAQLWRYALTWALADDRGEPADAIVVARDTDGKPSRLDGLASVVALFRDLDPTRPVLIAAPHQDLEAWIVLGFVPQGGPKSAEATRLAKVNKRLSFNPTHEPERLTASPNDAPTDAKLVLNGLLDIDKRGALPAAELAFALERCLPNLDRIRRFGVACGAADFVTQVQTNLAPVFGLPS